VPLSEEIAFLDCYLEIERTRFGDRLKIEKQIAAETQDALVPFLLLQPLVENAIRHGIEPREQTGHVAISAQLNDGVLELRITDDGAGLSGQAATGAREGIGLSTRVRGCSTFTGLNLSSSWPTWPRAAWRLALPSPTGERSRRHRIIYGRRGENQNGNRG